MHRILSPGELLDPRHAVVPFHGRVRELAALARWRDRGDRSSVLLLHGPSGIGKTRLAHHFADDAVRVVDDADLLPWHELLDLLRESTADRARVLLVARRTGWWWSAVRQRAADLDYSAAELEPAARPAEHGMSFASACAHFADALGLPRPTTPPPPADTVHDLHLAALAAVHGSPSDDPVELVRWLADVDQAPPTRGRLAEDVLAVTLLDDRIEPERTRDALDTLLRAAERWPHALRRAEDLFTAHPELAGVATASSLTVLAGRPAPARAIARHVFNDPRFHCDALPAVLTRTLLHDCTGGKSELAELHGMLAARAALAALREEALEAARNEVALYRELVDQDPAEYRPALADALADLGLRLIAVKRDEESLAASEEAVLLCRMIAEDDDDCKPQLAAALDQLGLRYAALGRREEALTATDRAFRLYHELSEHNPALFRLDHAKVAHHLAVRLFDVERRDEAAHAAESAVVRWRAVADADPRYEAEFARTLASIASLLSAFGQREEASVVVRESIDVLRRLAAANPRDFEPELAAALGNLSTVLCRLERPSEALAASEESVLVWRRVARDGDPQAVGELAAALGEQVDGPASQDGEYLPARLAVAEEAVELLRPLATRFPVGHHVEFAVAQARLARLLLRAGHEYGAWRIVDEVLSVERRLPHRVLLSHGGKLASALQLLATALVAAEQEERALRLAEQVAGIWRDLLGHHRGAPMAYATAVHRTAVLMRAVDHPETLTRARLAVLVWHLTRTPDELADEPGYADTLSLYARVCAGIQLGLDQALLLAHEAVMVLRAAKAAPDHFARAVEAVDEVVRAHPDPQAARARAQALVARDWPSSW
ncbi:tetratricopeptide (TPR) repeat protein [Saccharothrix tamanrassetensis]|uniref:Tetratricopeptide (TPR) repeat protein n=1 Tax=Saccharothrix tamanrassetensis TaxID=1051531 RepID=A0A841CGH4_9PSEU|nr:tetratricopeptide repeat protein [Saccharothrix tamanrassetensis]MBB5957622.1 tetratricopeptide (TPR) repeat protein [Saccharothrix tamanrassetensis]